MDVKDLLATIDAQIAKVQDARAKIVDLSKGMPAPNREVPARSSSTHAKPKRQLSPEGRARIAEAQRRRHAARHGSTAQDHAPAAVTSDE